MLQNIRHIYGDKLFALDGGIGFVKDFYFEANGWVIRYLMVDTGTWLSERKVLLTPHVFGPIDPEKNLLSVNLTRQQIEDGPRLDSDRPISRQFEEAYYQHYGWPVYWERSGPQDIAGSPLVESLLKKDRPHQGPNQRNDIHLRSTKGMAGYKVQGIDGGIGSVRSFMVDDQTWAIEALAVETGHWNSGKTVLIPTSQVGRINYEDLKIFINFPRASIQLTGDHEVVRTTV